MPLRGMWSYALCAGMLTCAFSPLAVAVAVHSVKKATSMISTLKLGFANMQLEAAAVAKKCMAFLASLQEEINLCMKDTGEKLKQYTADQLGFAKAKEKLDKEEEKGKAGKKSDKLKEKMELAWKKVQNSRNDYLLALQTLNVQQDRYFKIELPASKPNNLSLSLSLPAFLLPPSLPFCFHPGGSGNIYEACVFVFAFALVRCSCSCSLPIVCSPLEMAVE